MTLQETDRSGVVGAAPRDQTEAGAVLARDRLRRDVAPDELLGPRGDQVRGGAGLLSIGAGEQGLLELAIEGVVGKPATR
jgi:hypothetical protein